MDLVPEESELEKDVTSHSVEWKESCIWCICSWEVERPTGRLGWTWQPSRAPQTFCNTKNGTVLGAVHQNCASPPISLNVPRDPGPALSRVVWQLLEPSTTASYADKEGESQGWCKEQLCALLFAGPGAEACRVDGQRITVGVHRYETCWLPTAFEIKLGKTKFSDGHGAQRWMSHIFPCW